MTNEQILCRVLTTLGYEQINIEELEERLKIQKLVYLIQSRGLSLGYGYIWYVRGPYSPTLTQTVYQIGENPTLFNTSKSLRFKDHEEIESRLSDFMTIMNETIHDCQYLEILSSIHYINKLVFEGKGSKQRVKKKLYEAKPGLLALQNIELITDKAYDDLVKFN